MIGTQNIKLCREILKKQQNYNSQPVELKTAKMTKQLSYGLNKKKGENANVPTPPLKHHMTTPLYNHKLEISKSKP